MRQRVADGWRWRWRRRWRWVRLGVGGWWGGGSAAVVEGGGYLWPKACVPNHAGRGMRSKKARDQWHAQGMRPEAYSPSMCATQGMPKACNLRRAAPRRPDQGDRPNQGTRPKACDPRNTEGRRHKTGGSRHAAQSMRSRAFPRHALQGMRPNACAIQGTRHKACN